MFRKNASLLAMLAGLFSALVLAAPNSLQAINVDEFFGDAQASSSVQGTPATTIAAHSSIIGGNRTLFALKNSAGAGVTRIETFPDPDFLSDTDHSLGYTQGAHTGQGIVTWDGDNSAATLSPNGLGSIDFLQDDATALLLGVKFFDFPASHPIDITVRVYDASNPSALTYSDLTITLNQAMSFSSPFDLTLPFSLLTTAGASTIPGPSASTFSTNTSFGPSGAANLTRVGAIQLIINGLANSSAPDLTLDYLKSNGRCDMPPNAEGRVVDECGVCLNSALANQGRDRCGTCMQGPGNYNYQNERVLDGCNLCPGEDFYDGTQGLVGQKDTCGVCLGGPAPYVYTDMRDACALCPSHPNYGHAQDPCGLCFGDGTTCADCAGVPNGQASYDQCGVCGGNGTTCVDCAGTLHGTQGFDICHVCGGNGTGCLDCNGQPFGTAKLDACGVCGGTAQNANQCSSCVTVEATDEVRDFEKRLLTQATTLRKRFRADVTRAKRTKCKLELTKRSAAFELAYKTIRSSGEDIFTKGVEVCGNSCVTVSYAEQVEQLQPSFKLMERSAKKLATEVQACYAKVKGKYTGTGAGVTSTITNVRNGLNQLIEDCRDRQVCPPAS